MFEVRYRVQRSSSLKVNLQCSHFSSNFAVDIIHEFGKILRIIHFKYIEDAHPCFHC